MPRKKVPVRLRNAQRKRYYNKNGAFNASNRFQHWTLKEEMLVWYHDQPDTELARMIGRSVQSIQLKRWELKKEASIGLQDLTYVKWDTKGQR